VGGSGGGGADDMYDDDAGMYDDADRICGDAQV